MCERTTGHVCSGMMTENVRTESADKTDMSHVKFAMRTLQL